MIENHTIARTVKNERKDKYILENQEINGDLFVEGSYDEASIENSVIHGDMHIKVSPSYCSTAFWNIKASDDLETCSTEEGIYYSKDRKNPDVLVVSKNNCSERFSLEDTDASKFVKICQYYNRTENQIKELIQIVAKYSKKSLFLFSFRNLEIHGNLNINIFGFSLPPSINMREVKAYGNIDLKGNAGYGINRLLIHNCTFGVDMNSNIKLSNIKINNELNIDELKINGDIVFDDLLFGSPDAANKARFTNIEATGNCTIVLKHAKLKKIYFSNFNCLNKDGEPKIFEILVKYKHEELGEMTFNECTFNSIVKLSNISVKDMLHIPYDKTEELYAYPGVKFIKTRFNDKLICDARFTAPTDFSTSTFEEAPVFYGATLYPDTRFPELKMFKKQNGKSEEKAYAYLMDQSRKIVDKEGQSLFYTLMHRCKRKQKRYGAIRFLSFIYDQVSDYGVNYIKSLRAILLFVVLFGLVYSNHLNIKGEAALPSLEKGFAFSMQQTFVPFAIWRQRTGTMQFNDSKFNDGLLNDKRFYNLTWMLIASSQTIIIYSILSVFIVSLRWKYIKS